VDDGVRALGQTVARRVGRELAAAAYVVLEHRAAAQDAAAAGIGDVLRGIVDPATIGQPGFHDALVGATLRRALDARQDLREVDPLADGAGLGPLATLSPVQLAVSAGHLMAGASIEGLAPELSMTVPRVRDALITAEDIVGGREALARRLEAQHRGLPLAVSIEAVEQAFAGPPLRPTSRWRRMRTPVATMALTAVVAGVGIVNIVTAAAQADGAEPDGRHPAQQESSPPAQAKGAPQAADSHPTLADCDIQPSSTELAFRGPIAMTDLVPAAGASSGATTVYALVTASDAEWVGWQTGGARAMFPRPVGRLACAVNPVSGAVSVFAISDSWRPPPAEDRCPTLKLPPGSSSRIPRVRCWLTRLWAGSEDIRPPALN
jgi:hypothetical protein